MEGSSEKRLFTMGLISSALLILVGILSFIGTLRCAPVTREEAVAFTGEFASYESWDSPGICFRNGAFCPVAPSTATDELLAAMEALEEGTILYVLVNPSCDFVVEIRTDTEELMNFDEAQEAILGARNAQRELAAVLCLLGILTGGLVVLIQRAKKRQQAQLSLFCDGEETAAPTASPVLRYAATDVKHRVLLEATATAEDTATTYRICYRRVKSVNELVINGYVYAELRGVIEFEHALCAAIDGHRFEAGLDPWANSYIAFDGTIIAKKKRLL